MAEPSWEAATSGWAYGYLKFLDFQSAGFDVHATFQKAKSVHVSVYAVGTTSSAKLGMQQLTIGVTGVSLEASKRLLVKNIVSPSDDLPQDYWPFFESRCTQKATELGIFAPQQTTTSQPAMITTSTAQKGGSSGLTTASTWGDAQRTKAFNSAFPSLTTKGT